jgi:HEAT repeat protein
MEQSFILDFLKEIAVGFKTAKSYPPGHPVMEKVVGKTMLHLSKIYTELSGFSMYFLEKTVIFQDQRIDIGKNPAMASLLDTLRKNEINSLTFDPGVTNDDVKNLYEVIISPKLKVREYGDAATMLTAKGTQRVKINAVKFGIQTGTTTQATEAATGAAKEHAEVVEAIKNLKELVEQGITMIDTKSKFNEVMDDIDHSPKESQHLYRESVARIIETLPAEHRIELLRDVELKPIIMKMFSSLSEDTLAKMICSRAESDKGDDVKKIISALGESKFANVMPKLKEKIPNIYEYLAQVGLVLSEKLATTISKEDLRIAMKPYFSMLDSESPNDREKGLRSLISLAQRFIEKKDYEQAGEFITRISTAIAQESVGIVVFKILDDLNELYQGCKKNDRKNFCSMLVEPFSKILGRGGLSPAFKKKAIKFLSETGNIETLPMLFSFLWESGIYPDVREAIIQFGKDAVNEALLTLKEAENHDLRRKLTDILKNIGPVAVDLLLDNLEATDEWYLKRHIIAIIGGVGDKRVIDRLLPFIEDEDERVRAELVRTFTKFEYDEGLMKLLNDPSSDVKAESLKGLKTKIDHEKILELLSLFKQKGDAMHLELLRIINEQKVADAIDAIVSFLTSLALRKDSKAVELKEYAVSILVKLKPNNLKEILENLTLSKDKKLIHLAETALKRIT